MLAIFGISTLLRFALALVNREANDPHMDVIQLILRNSRLPHANEAWEAFQPKLFHWTMAQGIRWLGLQSADSQLVFVQLVNALAGSLVILCVLVCIRNWNLSPSIRTLSFAITAFNPTLVGISAQATNDTFVILFATLAIAAAVDYFRSGRLFSFAGMVLATILAGLSKGNGLVVMAALLGVWGLRMIIRGRRTGWKWVLGSGLLLAVWLGAFLAIVPVWGQYIERYREQGNPFVTNTTPDPLPSLSARSETGRPGVVSFTESYLSFPVIDLLQHPLILSQKEQIDPANRVSIWAQLYGRANFVQFDDWPPSWRTRNPTVLDIGRILLVLAFFPTLAGVIWFFAVMARVILRLVRSGDMDEEHWLHLVVVAGYFLFVLYYAWEYRDFATMKAIFLFPGILSITFFLSGGLESVFRIVKNRLGRLLGYAASFRAGGPLCD